MKKTEKEMEAASKENEESKRRAVFMVVFNSTLNFLTRVPLMVASVNDLRLLIEKPNSLVQDSFNFNLLDLFITSFTFKFYCSSVKACLVFESFGNCLYLFSLASTLFFLKCFDKNFKKAFKTLIFSNLSQIKRKETF